MANEYVSAATLKTTLQTTGTYADADYTAACAAASKAIEEACGRRFWLDADANQVRYYTALTPNYVNGYAGYYTNFGVYSNQMVLDIDDLTTFTSLTLDFNGDGTYSTTWVKDTDFYLDPINAAADSYPYERVVIKAQSGKLFPVWDNAVKVTGAFGWPSVPPQVTEYAGILAAQLLLRSRQAPFGVIMAGMELGASARISRFDPDFDRLLGRFAKPPQLLA